MSLNRIIIDTAPFDVGQQYQWLSQSDSDGAIVTFIGKVRNHNLSQEVSALKLEHYPEMTEKTLYEIVELARQRWPLQRIAVIHRIGELFVGEEIVFVGVSSSHRNVAFAAAEFIMDFLKTRAPFWKKETTEKGQYWVDEQHSDVLAAQRWK